MKHGKHITIDDLPPAYRKQAEAQLKVIDHREDDLRETMRVGRDIISRSTTPPPAPARTRERKPSRPHRQPNKTEARFNLEMLGGRGRYEAVSFRTPAGRYTPDFCVWGDDGHLTCYEVKGGHRLDSQQAARRAFLDTADRFPHVTFKWYKRTKNGWEEWYKE